jgi:hypothetical protein
LNGLPRVFHVFRPPNVVENDDVLGVQEFSDGVEVLTRRIAIMIAINKYEAQGVQFLERWKQRLLKSANPHGHIVQAELVKVCARNLRLFGRSIERYQATKSVKLESACNEGARNAKAGSHFDATAGFELSNDVE